MQPAAIDALLRSEVVVEEKLDGANVTVWLASSGQLEAALRGGPDSLDRAGQRGPLRAWVATNDGPLRQLLDGWEAAYCEWLLLTHTVEYERLPAYLIVLDLWRQAGWATPPERDSASADAGLSTPPQIWKGVPGTIGAVEGLLGVSAWGEQPVEGVVVRRTTSGKPRLAKLVRSGFDRTGDDQWRGGRPHNQLAAGEASWH